MGDGLVGSEDGLLLQLGHEVLAQHMFLCIPSIMCAGMLSPSNYSYAVSLECCIHSRRQQLMPSALVLQGGLFAP